MSKNKILQILNKYKAEKNKKYGILSLGIFGSAARDEMRSNSNIDIVIETEEPDPFKLVHIKDDLEELLKTEIDIIRVRKKMNSVLKDRIAEEAVYL